MRYTVPGGMRLMWKRAERVPHRVHLTGDALMMDGAPLRVRVRWTHPTPEQVVMDVLRPMLRAKGKQRARAHDGWTMPDGTRLEGIHAKDACAPGWCVVHNPMSTHMDGWRLFWRGDRGIFERICPHGIGHPDPSQFAWWAVIGQGWMSVHGCDGCCGGVAA